MSTGGYEQNGVGGAKQFKLDEVANQLSVLSAEQLKRLQSSLQKPRLSVCPVPAVFFLAVFAGVFMWKQATRLQEVTANEALAIAEVHSLEETVDELRSATDEALQQHDNDLDDQKASTDNILDDVSRKHMALEKTISKSLSKMTSLERAEANVMKVAKEQMKVAKEQKIRKVSDVSQEDVRRIAKQQQALASKQAKVASQQQKLQNDMVAKHKELAAKQQVSDDAIADVQKDTAVAKASLTERVTDLEAAMVYQDERVNGLDKKQSQQWAAERRAFNALGQERSSINPALEHNRRAAEALQFQLKRQRKYELAAAEELEAQRADLARQNQSIENLVAVVASQQRQIRNHRQLSDHLEHRQRSLDADESKQNAVVKRLEAVEQKQGEKLAEIAQLSSDVANEFEIRNEVERHAAPKKIVIAKNEYLDDGDERENIEEEDDEIDEQSEQMRRAAQRRKEKAMGRHAKARIHTIEAELRRMKRRF